MAYADQEMSGNKIVAIIIVALIHIGVGYVLITGLAYEAVQQIAERVTTVDIDEPEPEEEEPPPPPEEVPETVVPPPFIPPPPLPTPNRQTQRSSDTMQNESDPVDTRPQTKQCPDGSTVLATAQCGPATKQCPDGKSYPINATCPPVNRVQPKNPEPRSNPGRWASARDYPRRALQQEREGVTRFTVTVGTNGRVTNCRVTGSSGHGDLDETTCKLIQRRGRFRPATDGNGDETTGTWSSAVRWEIPQ